MLVGCGVKPPPVTPEEPVAAETPPAGAYGDPTSPVAGEVLGTVIHTQDAEELRYVILKQLTDQYAHEKGVSVTQAETDTYVANQQAFMAKDRVRRQANGEASPAESTVETQDESDEDKAARQEIAVAFILQWKVNRALYQQYGGRIGYQQGGPEPLDAYRAFLEERQARGEFKILNKQLEAAFWHYYRTDDIHEFYPRGSPEEAQAFSVPPWLVE
jgi:hypothetical protein